MTTALDRASLTTYLYDKVGFVPTREQASILNSQHLTLQRNWPTKSKWEKEVKGKERKWHQRHENICIRLTPMVLCMKRVERWHEERTRETDF